MRVGILAGNGDEMGTTSGSADDRTGISSLYRCHDRDKKVDRVLTDKAKKRRREKKRGRTSVRLSYEK